MEDRSRQTLSFSGLLDFEKENLNLKMKGFALFQGEIQGEII